MNIETPKYHLTKEYKIFTVKHSLNNLRFSPAMTPSGRFGIRSNKNSRRIKSPFVLSDVKEKKVKPPVSKKMESDQSASSSDSSDSSSSNSKEKHVSDVLSAPSLIEVAPAEVAIPAEPKRSRHMRNSGLPNRISNLSIQTTGLL